MIKRRVIGTLLLRDGILVQSMGFSTFLPVGRAGIGVEYLNRWGADEIVLLDISTSRSGRDPDYDLIRNISYSCRIPLTVGGGVKSVQMIERLLHCGADKVVINTAAYHCPEFVKESARIFGNQCIVVGIDSKCVGHNQYQLVIQSGAESTGVGVADYARVVEELGAGEIFLNSVDRDGTKQGFDLDLISLVRAAVGIPLIVCGGAGNPEHVFEVFKRCDVSAVAVGNMIHFSEHSVLLIKRFLALRGLDLRLDLHADYAYASFDEMGRLDRRDEFDLAELCFEYAEDEKI